jgi:hypothetical protein
MLKISPFTNHNPNTGPTQQDKETLSQRIQQDVLNNVKSSFNSTSSGGIQDVETDEMLPGEGAYKRKLVDLARKKEQFNRKLENGGMGGEPAKVSE